MLALGEQLQKSISCAAHGLQSCLSQLPPVCVTSSLQAGYLNGQPWSGSGFLQLPPVYHVNSQWADNSKGCLGAEEAATCLYEKLMTMS